MPRPATLLPLLLLATYLPSAGAVPVAGGCQAPASPLGSHCACPEGVQCTGSGCQEGHGAAGRVFYGYKQSCRDCRCVTAPGQAAGGQAAGGQDAARQPAAKDSQCGRRAVVFLKFHKVGSTTVSVALERYAKRRGLKLCGRAESFLPSLPCQVSGRGSAAPAASGGDAVRWYRPRVRGCERQWRS